MDHRKLAEEENEWWEALTSEERRRYGNDITKYWKDLDNRSSHQVRYRRIIFIAQSDLLWKALEDGMAITTVGQVARKAARENLAISEVLADCKANPQAYKGLHKKKAVAARLSGEWGKLELAAKEAVSSVLIGEDPATIDHHVGNFMVEVKLAIAELRERLRRDGNRTISRIKLVSACRQLGVNPPKLGALVTEQARRNAKAILKDTHPDRTGGNKAQEEVFRQTTEALRVIEDYNEQCKKGNGNGHG